MEDAVALTALFCLSLAYFGILAPYGLELADEGHLLHQIYRTYLGQVPYVDFHTGYSPGAYYLNAWLLHAFDSSLLAVRLFLALINALSVTGMFVLARKLGASRLAALLAGVGYIALIPFFDGTFAPFNIPYPAWYVTTFWLAGVYFLIRWWEHGNRTWLVLTGICAGAVFSFKQNSGLLALATGLYATALLQKPTPPSEGRGGFLLLLDRLARVLIPIVLALGFFRLFGGFAPGSQAVPLVAPLFVTLLGLMALPRSLPARPVAAGRLTSEVILLGIGFAAVTIPWLAYFWGKLGTVALLRNIFYIGLPYEQHYLIPYPPFGSWGQMLAIAAIVFAALPALAKRVGVGVRTFLTAVALAAVAGAALVILRPPPMVEGFQASVVMRARDISFAAVLVLLWAGVLTYFTRVRRRSRRAGVHLILVFSAILMHMQIYPRSDFMHLVYAAPGAMILGAWMLDVWAGRFATGLGITERYRAVAHAMLQTPAWLLVVVFLVPALMRIDYLLRAWNSHDPTALVRLESPRAPLVIEPSGGRMFESLSAAVRFIDANTSPEDRIFTFPCLDALTFLSNRQEASRHGYYYPGSPGHAVEAEVIDSLETTPPKYVLSLHAHALFFVGAPVYYFNLHDYITSEFVLARRLGLLDVLESGQGLRREEPGGSGEELRKTVSLWTAELRHDRGATAARLAARLEAKPVQTVEDLAAIVTDSPAAEQSLLAELIQKSRSSPGAAALAIAATNPDLPAREFQRFARIINGVADLEAVPAILAGLDRAAPDRRAWFISNLFTISSKSWIEGYFYAPEAQNLPPKIAAVLPTGKLINWIQDPWENPGLRSFAVRMAGRSNDRALVPFLMRMAGDSGVVPSLRLDAAHSLAEMGFGTFALPILAKLLPNDELVPGTLIASIQPHAPDATRQIVAGYLTDLYPPNRLQAYWIAAGMRDPELLPLLEQGLNDPIPEVRMAAAWGLGRLGGDKARTALESSVDAHDEVSLFVERALRRVRRDDGVGDAALTPGARPVPPPEASDPPAHPS